MYKQKISVTVNSNFDKEKIFEEFEILLANYYKNGQIQGDYETPFINKNEIIAYQTTIERNSLSKKYNDEYTSKRIKNIELWSNSKIITEVIGVVPNVKDTCRCKKHKYFVLFTHVFNETSPLDCGTCGKVIPIYKLENLTTSNRQEIFNWESNYKSCDILQLRCTVGEQWATKQMSDPNSQLSKHGLEVCKMIKRLTGVPTFYYLYNYRYISPQKDKARACPSCKGKWLLKKQLHNFYDFKCDKCKLISSFSPNSNR